MTSDDSRTLPASGPDSRRFTYTDYAALPDDGLRYEIIDGRLFVTPAPSSNHQRTCGNLYLLLRRWSDAHPPVEVLFSPIDLILAEDSVLQPDLVVSLHPESSYTRRGIEQAPVLAVEVLSPSTHRRDRGLKRDRYARAGVEEYWVVDPKEQTVEQYCRDPSGKLALRSSYAQGDSIRSSVLEGLEFEVNEVFARVRS